MIYPGTANGGSGYSMGGGDPNDLEERKRQLVQRLMQSGARNQSGLQGLHAMPLFGGRGRGSSDLPNAALPSLSFNPFLAMAAGRPNELFQAPDGVTSDALSQAQQGLVGPVGGAAPSDPSLQAAQTFLGAGVGTPGLDGPAATLDDPNQAWGVPTSSNIRHLTGGGIAGLVPVQSGFRIGSVQAR